MSTDLKEWHECLNKWLREYRCKSDISSVRNTK